MVHVGGYLVEQQRASLYEVGVCKLSVKPHVGVEGALHLRQRRVPLAVVVHQPVEADGVSRGDMAAAVYLGLQRAAGADAHQLQLPVASRVPHPVLHPQGGVQLGHDDVDVVTAHAGAEGCHAGAVVAAGEGMELAVVALELDAFEDVFEHVDPRGVTNEQHLVGQGAAVEVYVVEAAVRGEH